MAKVLVTGGAGAIGTRLIPKLQEEGHEVCIIGRTKHDLAGAQSFTWDLQQHTMESEALDDVTHIIHLAGAGIADASWSPKRKKVILDSRVTPLQLLRRSLQDRGQKVEAIISSSAVGYYGAVTSDAVFEENDAAADDFLGETCRKWEQAVIEMKDVAEREVRVRTGIVLMKDDGALPKLAKPVKFGVGAPIGSGKQWMPWIHVNDLVGIFLKSVNDVKMNGAFNAVTPQHIDQRDFIDELGQLLHRPTFLPPIPGFLVRTVMGDMAKIITEGSRVSSKKVQQAGYTFQFSTLSSALQELYS